MADAPLPNSLGDVLFLVGVLTVAIPCVLVKDIITAKYTTTRKFLSNLLQGAKEEEEEDGD